MATGEIVALWRWPVKSMGGERTRSLQLDARGVAGDRTHAVLREFKGAWRPMTAREAPRLLAWRAAYPFAPGATVDPEQPPHASLTAPDGHDFLWDDPRLRHALAADLGHPVALRRDVAGIQDLERSVLLTTDASHRALEAELGTPIDPRRFRTNLHLALDAPAWADLGWEGRTLSCAGGLVLELLHPCVRCAIPTRDPDTQAKWPVLLRHLHAEHGQRFGINARVLRAGRVETGEAVQIG